MDTCIQKIINQEERARVLKENVIVYCSTSRCRFKRNDGYYNSCKNPIVLENNIDFIGGHVYRDGCICAGCSKDDCKIKEHQVSVLQDLEGIDINEESILELGDNSEIINICEKED